MKASADEKALVFLYDNNRSLLNSLMQMLSLEKR